mgnify:CR=1
MTDMSPTGLSGDRWRHNQRPLLFPFLGFVWLSALEEIGRQASRQLRDWTV